MMGQGASPDEITDLIKEVDYNNTGVVEWKKFLMLMRKFYPEKLKAYEEKWYTPAKKFTQFSREDIDVFIESFRNYDLDDSGAINTGELLLAFWMMGQGVTPDEVEFLIKKYDADGSGEIEWSEYLTMVSEIYSGKDIFEDTKPIAKPAPKTTPQSTPPSTPPTTPKSTSSPGVEKQSSNSSFQGAKPDASLKQSPSATKISVGNQRGSTSKCDSCGKTVYPIESISAANRTFHKGCFKCESSEGCTLLLNLNTYTIVQGKIFCKKHIPKEKHTSTPVDGSIHMQNAKSAPKVAKVQGINRDQRLTFGAADVFKKDQK